MNEINRVLKIAAWRLFITDLFRTLTITFTGVVLALIGLRLAQQLFGLDLVWPGDWMRAFAAAAGLAVVAALAWSVVRRSRGVAVARELDERANLRESLSTALCVARSDDPWAKVVLETARERAVSVKVGQAIPYEAPRMWPMPFATALSLLIVWYAVPAFDIFGWMGQREAVKAQENEVRAVSNEIKLNDEKLEEALRKAKVEIEDEDGEKGDAADSSKPTTADEMRRASVKKLTSLTEKLNEQKNSDKAKQLDAMKQMMKQLKQPGPGPLDQLSKSLQKGDFSQAQKDLEELSKQLAENKMSAEQKEQLQKQMEKMAEQLSKMAEAKQEMEKKLEQAGMSKEQAKQAMASPEAMKQALESLKNMSEQEKKDLMKQMQAKMEACKSCEGMSESMSKMAKGMGKSGMSQEGQQGMEAMAGQLSEMEMMQSDMEGLDAAMEEAMKQLSSMAGQCNGGNGNGDELKFSDRESPWRLGDTSQNKGGGRGGPGISGGSNAGSETEAPVAIEKTKARTKQGDGPIIGSRLVQGDQVRGESVAEFQAAVEAAEKASTEAVGGMTVPRELQDSVKGYFGRLKARVEPKSK